MKGNDIMSKYSIVIIYTKKGNLLDYFTDSIDVMCRTKEEYDRKREYYAKEREIQLIAMFRFEPADGPYAGRTFCKIKCPINPLPVKGEFEIPSINVLGQVLKGNGWNFKQKFYPRMFE